jgi:peptidoglycan-associated lipoprotein
MSPNMPSLPSTALFAVIATLVVACGGSKPPVAQSADSAPSAATSGASRGTATSSPTASNVAISDEIRSKCGIRDEDAYFPFDSSNLTTNDRSPLQQVATCFTRGPLAGHGVKLVGRADPRGSPDYNLTLGQARADAVGIYLDGRGISKSKTQTTSRGAMDASGSDENGWQRDRRVDVMLGD